MSIHKEARVVLDQEPEKPRPRLLLAIAVAVVMVGGVLLLPTNDAPVADDQPDVNELPEPATAVEMYRNGWRPVLVRQQPN